MNLSPHFALEEFICSTTAAQKGIDNTPTTAIVAELRRLADVMEKVRTLLHSTPVIITSGYRCPQLNAEVGGVSNSSHLYGQACDFIVPSYGSPETICKALQPHMEELKIDQLIYEFAQWVHLGIAARDATPRAQALIIDRSGTRGGFTTEVT